MPSFTCLPCKSHSIYFERCPIQTPRQDFTSTQPVAALRFVCSCASTASADETMFSPEVTGQSTLSLRNPRRRPRNSSEDHLASRQATKRRKRSSLTPSSFEPAVKAKTNGHLPIPNGHHVAKEQSPELSASRGNTSEKTSLVIRRHPSRSEKEKKISRHSDGIVLVRFWPLRARLS